MAVKNKNKKAELVEDIKAGNDISDIQIAGVINEKEIPPSCDCSGNINDLHDMIDNILDCLSELISLTGTGRILAKYGLKTYDVTKEDKSIGKFLHKTGVKNG